MKRPTRNFPDFFEHLKSTGFTPAICIDVGAAAGTTSIYEAFPEAHHVAIEPLPDFHEQLEQTLSPYSHEIHHCALMDKAGEAKLLKHADKFGSSMMHRRKKDSEKLVPVEVKTLDELMNGKDLSRDVLLKTDCQGADLFVLKGARETLNRANMVIVEASLFKFWGPHHPDIYEIMTFMHGMGFVVYDILDGLFRPHDNALGQVDLAFVKHNGRLRATHQW